MYQYILVVFLHKAYSKVDFRHAKISDTIFLGQSLLLSITVLNDNYNDDLYISLCVYLAYISVTTCWSAVG